MAQSKEDIALGRFLSLVLRHDPKAAGISLVILPIDAERMHRDGHPFYRSENGVWLCTQVPWDYILEEEILF